MSKENKKEDLIKELEEKNISFPEGASTKFLKELLSLEKDNKEDSNKKDKSDNEEAKDEVKEESKKDLKKESKKSSKDESKENSKKHFNKVVEEDYYKEFLENDNTFIKTKKYIDYFKFILFGIVIFIFIGMQIDLFILLSNNENGEDINAWSIIGYELLSILALIFVWFISYVSIKAISFLIDYLYMNRKDRN